MTLEIHGMAGHLIRRLQQISVSVFQKHMSEAQIDLTSVQFAALSGVASFPGIDQASLAGLIAYDRATIGGVIDRLEGKGLLKRFVDPNDRRARRLTLTEAGAATFKTAAPIVSRLQDDILSGLDADERAQFIRLAGKATELGNALSRAPMMPPNPAARRKRVPPKAPTEQ